MDQDLFVGTMERWIKVVMHNSMANLARYARENGFSMQQLMALSFISRHESCGVSDLGERMGVTSAAASQLLDRLVQQDLVLRTEDPKDRRSKLIALTEKGNQILSDSDLARSGWLTMLEDILSPEEYQQTLQVMKMLTEKALTLDYPADSKFGIHP